MCIVFRCGWTKAEAQAMANAKAMAEAKAKTVQGQRQSQKKAIGNCKDEGISKNKCKTHRQKQRHPERQWTQARAKTKPERQ